MAEAKLIQIHYEESQKAHMFPFAVPHYNAGLTIFFENAVLAPLVMSSDSKKIAVCSWKLRQKLKWNVPGPVKARELTQDVLETDYEVLSFTRNSRHHRMLEALEIWHPGSLKALDRILQILGVGRPSEVRNPIYQNHFSAQTEIYQDYVKHYLNPAMQAIENDKGLNSMVMVDSKYTELTHSSGEHLKEKLGINYYPLVPFVLERMFSIYVDNEGLKVTHL